MTADVPIIDEKHTERFPEEHTRVTSMTRDGNCGFRAVAHQVYDDQNLWPRVRKDLLAAFEKNPNGYCNNIKKNYDRDITPARMRETLKAPRRKLAPVDKWLSKELHLQIVADCYDMAVVTICLTHNHPEHAIRIPTERYKEWKADADIKYGIKVKRLEIIGLKIDSCHWDAIDLDSERIISYLHVNAPLIQSHVGN